MANANNFVNLLGRLAHEHKLEFTNNGTAVLTVDLIVYDYWNKNEEKEENQKVRCKMYGKRAKNIAENANLMKGQQISVCGSLKIDSRGENQKGYYPWVRIDDLRLGMKPLGYYKSKWKEDN